MPFYPLVTPEAAIQERLTYYKGTSFKFKNESVDGDNQPFDFTGYEFQMLIKRRAGEADADAVVVIPNASFTLSETAEGTTAGVQDVYEIDEAPASFDGLVEEPFEYFYVIQATDGAGSIFNHYLGKFVVKND